MGKNLYLSSPICMHFFELAYKHACIKIYIQSGSCNLELRLCNSRFLYHFEDLPIQCIVSAHRFVTDTTYFWRGCNQFPPCNYSVPLLMRLLYSMELGFYVQVK